MNWKDFFAPIGVIASILVIVSIIYAVIYIPRFQKIYKKIMEEPMGSETGIQLLDESCIANSEYSLTLKNNTLKVVAINDLSFYIDDSRVSCEGISNNIEPGTSIVCKISQFTSKGSHSLDISGPNFSLGTSVNCK
jgi:hypothetical protein